MTVFPFSRRKCFIRDSTCIDSLSPTALALTALALTALALTALALTAVEHGSSPRSANVRKKYRYEGLSGRYISQAIAVESFCVVERNTDESIA